MENAKLEFTPEALRAIARKALEKKTGARALRQLVESLMLDVMFDLPSRKDAREYVVTEKNVLGLEPVTARPLKSTPSAKKEGGDAGKKETA
jgi:ATP-dependent Clp protease ATP-binding subunit ClpX